MLQASDLQYILNTKPMYFWQKAFNIDTPLIDFFGGIKTHQGDGNIYIPFHHGRNDSVGPFDEGDTITSSTGEQSKRKIKIDWSRYKGGIDVDGLAEAISKLGAYDLTNDLVLEELEDLIDDILSDIEDDLSGDGTGDPTPIYGTNYWIADDNTVGGLDRSSYTWLASYVSDNGGTDRSLTKSLLQTMISQLEDTRGSKWDTALTSRTMAYVYEALMGDAKRYVDVKVGDVFMKALAIDGKPLIPVPGYGDRIDFIRKKDWELQAVPHVSRDTYGRMNKGLFKVEERQPTTDSTRMFAFIYLQLVCKNPYKQASLQDIE